MNTSTIELLKPGFFVFLAIYLIASIAYFISQMYMKSQQKKLDRERAMLDVYRAHHERQLMEMNLRFSEAENRWRELNHLVIAGQSDSKFIEDDSPTIQVSSFLKSHGIDPRTIQQKQDLIFVLTPFHDDLLDEFLVAKKVGQSVGFNVLRGDERATSGDIFPQILRHIIEARIIIANISGRNPNVFYELGIAHALDKPVILLANSKSEIPFDISSKRIIFYSSNADLEISLSNMLTRVFAHSIDNNK
ncbi:MAG: hypothetical protein Q7U27_08960 [Pseudomonas sp.]|uniref:hypothetical protein n=1 Tax=Pseudomonas sp. TaxID=306 RepID=UPI002717A54A|nr:hypothetical protein [Pseudomonas sp.]MDO9328846.1 hypothetical protein [Pseudomonas sp.]